MKTNTHKYNILKILYDTRLKLTATDFAYISNSNQYFVELENQNLISSEWAYKGKTKVKLRFIKQKQISKVKTYLNAFNQNEINRES